MAIKTSSVSKHGKVIFMNSKVYIEYLKKTFYPVECYIHHDNIFSKWIEDSLDKDSIILDVGAGNGLGWRYNFKTLCLKVIGIDIDPRVKDNPNLHEAVNVDFLKNNFPSNYFDVVFANYVVEHIKQIDNFFMEIKRILKKGGKFYFRTLNKYHYAGFASSFLPYRFHVFYTSLLGRNADCVHPTFYKLNSKIDLDRLSRKMNFTYEIKMFDGYPGYLQISPLFFMLGIIYERIVNRFTILDNLKGILMGKIIFNKNEDTIA